MPRRILSLWLPRLPTDRLERAAPALAAGPLAVSAEAGGRGLVVAVNARAGDAGVAPGMTLANARALCPSLAVEPADPVADAGLLDRLALWCGRYTPWVAADGADGLFLDVTGCAHLFGGEAALIADLARRLDRFGLRHAIGLADTPLAAAALARFGDGGIAPAGEARHALAALPVEALRIDPATASGLRQVGLHRIGDLYPMPRASLAARFGLDPAQRLDRALGDLADPVGPARAVPPYRVRLNFPEPIGTPEDLARALDRLLVRLAARLEREGLGCRRLELRVFRVDGDVRRLAVGAARASREPRHLARLFAERLAGLDPGFGIETMVLAAPVTEPLHPAQTRLSGADAARPDGDVLDRLIDRLGAKLGAANVLRIRPGASHLPDLAARFACAFDAGDEEGEGSGWPALPPRPLRLLDRPEMVEALSAPPPGEAPAVFRWRGRRRLVRRARGPERIAPEWWRRNPGWDGGVRDYFAVEDRDGWRLWMFCEGLTAAGDAVTAPRWYVHGVFD